MHAPRKKLARLQLHCDALQAASGGVSGVIRDADDRRRATEFEALRVSPLKSIDAELLGNLAGRLRAEHDRLVADERSHPDNALRVRAGLVAVQLAIDAADHAAGLRAQRKRMQAELAPLVQLLAACRRFLGEDLSPLPVYGEAAR